MIRYVLGISRGWDVDSGTITSGNPVLVKEVQKLIGRNKKRLILALLDIDSIRNKAGRLEIVFGIEIMMRDDIGNKYSKVRILFSNCSTELQDGVYDALQSHMTVSTEGKNKVTKLNKEG